MARLSREELKKADMLAGQETVQFAIKLNKYSYENTATKAYHILKYLQERTFDKYIHVGCKTFRILSVAHAGHQGELRFCCDIVGDVEFYYMEDIRSGLIKKYGVDLEKILKGIDL